MKVKDLLEELKRLDPETELFRIENHMEQGRIVVPVRTVEIVGFRCGKETKEFRDAFDYGRYTDTVVRLSSLGMLERFIIKVD